MIRWPWQKKDRTYNSAADLARDLLASASVRSGVAVNWKTALQATTALACSRVIGEGLAQVPLKLHKARKGGGSDIAYAHPLHHLVHDAPNGSITSYEWRETAGMHLVFAGNTYAYKVRDPQGKILELLPMEPGVVTPKRAPDRTLRYEIRLADGAIKPVPAEDMLHLPGPSWDGWQGLDGVKLAREAIGLSLAAEEHNARMFGNGARLGGVLSTDGNLSQDQLKLLRDSWQDSQGGLANAYKTAILFGGLKFQPVAMQNDQAQMVELRSQQVEEVCRAFRVLPIIVGHSDKAATYASAEQMFLAHVVHTMGPWYARFEQRLNMSLLTVQERQAGYFFRFNIAGLLRGSHEARANYYSKALGAGGSPAWMSQDEVRDYEDLNPMGGAAAELPIATNVGGSAPAAASPTGA
jgi:HK97 family phage portal protein